MYKIDRRGGVQKSYTRKLPNTLKLPRGAVQKSFSTELLTCLTDAVHLPKYILILIAREKVGELGENILTISRFHFAKLLSAHFQPQLKK